MIVSKSLYLLLGNIRMLNENKLLGRRRETNFINTQRNNTKIKKNEK